MPDQLDELKDAVQRNCDIADAHHAQDYTLCIYLLKMREYFRWELDLSLQENPQQEMLSRWIRAREALWDDIMEEPFEKLELGGKRFDPFASEAINRHLANYNLVYSGGYSALLKPSFFLAELVDTQVHKDYRIHFTEREIARDIIAPPGMLQGQDIFIRRDAVRRYLNERREEWLWHRRQDALGQAFSAYAFDTDPDALKRMTDVEAQTVAMHELGEALAGNALGEEWNEMLVELGRSRAELTARAARDHLADSLVTLPRLIEEKNHASLAFYYANLSGIRREIFPQLNDAFKFWFYHGDLAPLSYIVLAGKQHWRRVTSGMLERYQNQPEDCRTAIQEYMEESLII